MNDATQQIGKYLSARSLPRRAGQTTNRWEILSTHGDRLGTVGWFPRWRQYTFDPELGTTFNDTCLVDIAKFLGMVNKARREAKP